MKERFLTYMRYERNMSPLTVQKYEEGLTAFQDYWEGKDAGLAWETVDADVVRDWMESLMDEGNSASTINRKLSTLRTFFRFAVSRGLVSHNPMSLIEGPKKSRPLPQFLKEDEMNRLLDGLEWSDTYKDVRARTIILLLYEAGLRRSELTGLNDADVDLAARQLKVTGKRNKQRVIPFGEELTAALQHYCELRDAETGGGSEAMFLNDKGQRISGAQVYNIVHRYLSAVTTLRKRSPHVLRHTFATAMLNNGAGLESIKKLLGHASVGTTEVYTHTTFEQLKRVYNEAHPRA